MTTLHLIHGFTGAGKTTFARQLEHDIGAVRFTHDEWMVRLYGSNPDAELFDSYFARINELIWEVTLRLLYKDVDVILDFGFWSRVSRDDARVRAHKAGAHVKLFHVKCSQHTMQERVSHRNQNLGGDSLLIDKHAFELFKTRFEPLDADEPHLLITTD